MDATCTSDRPKLLQRRRVRPPVAGGVDGGVIRTGGPVYAIFPVPPTVIGLPASAVVPGAISLPGANISVHPDIVSCALLL